MKAFSTRATNVLIYTFVLQLTYCLSCHDMPNPCGSAGCVSFGNNEQNQCSDLECPEVHVETCSNPCMMTTQAFSVPKRCCNAPCCSAPYCSIPAPQPMCSQPICSQPVCPQPPPIYATTTCITTPCPNKNPRPPPPPPPRPMPQMNPGCCCSYQYPQMAPPAPSYCVQSVVVGGKAETKKDDDKGKDDEEGKGKGKPDDVGRGGGRPEGGGPESGGPQPGAGRPRGRTPGTGLFIDPARVRGGGLGGAGLGGLPGLFGGGFGGLPGLLAGGFRFPGFRKEDDVCSRYENYLEKILDVIKEKVEPECVGPSPIMVMQDCCQPRVKVRKIRRRRKQRKYVVESCEAPEDEIVEEEEEQPCSCVIASPCCSRCSPRLRRCRHFF